MRFALALLCLFGTVAIATAQCLAPPYLSFCDNPPGSAHIKIDCATATPFPPVKGQPLNVVLKGSLNEQITQGTYTVNVLFDGIQLLSQSGDVCTLDPQVKCPIPANPSIVINQTVTIPDIAPSGDYEIDLSVQGSSSSDTIICAKITTSIADAAPRAAAPAPKKHKSKVHDHAPAVNQDMIDLINSMGTTWTAGHNKRFKGKTMKHVKALCGVLPGGPKLPVKHEIRALASMIDLPDSFDSRQQWGSVCPSTSDIRDQGSCGSCWAVSSASVMTDRTCIASNGTKTPYLASEDVNSCCDSCGMGCDGGYPSAAFDYWQSTGVVTGGPYNSKQGCAPYEVAACDHHVVGKLPPCGDEQPTPTCTQQCQNGADWTGDKHFAASSYSVPSDASSIATEIMTNGPVDAAFTVYEDFVNYKSGVYKHITGQELGGHAVKILGWGTENGTPYWLVANSWNQDWGDQGYFKIARGTDECGIEDGICAGLPQV